MSIEEETGVRIGITMAGGVARGHRTGEVSDTGVEVLECAIPMTRRAFQCLEEILETFLRCK